MCNSGSVAASHPKHNTALQQRPRWNARAAAADAHTQQQQQQHTAGKNMATEQKPAASRRRDGGATMTATASRAIANFASASQSSPALSQAAATVMVHQNRTSTASGARSRAEPRLILPAGTPHTKKFTPHARIFLLSIISLITRSHWGRTQEDGCCGASFQIIAAVCFCGCVAVASGVSTSAAAAFCAAAAAAADGSAIAFSLVSYVLERLRSVLAYYYHDSSLLVTYEVTGSHQGKKAVVRPSSRISWTRTTAHAVVTLLRRIVINFHLLSPPIGIARNGSPQKVHTSFCPTAVSSTQSLWWRGGTRALLLRQLLPLLFSLACYLSCCYEPAAASAPLPHHIRRAYSSFGPRGLPQPPPTCPYNRPTTALSAPSSFPWAPRPTTVPIATPILQPPHAPHSDSAFAAGGAPVYSRSLHSRPIRASTLLQQQQQHHAALLYRRYKSASDPRGISADGIVRSRVPTSAPAYVYTTSAPEQRRMTLAASGGLGFYARQHQRGGVQIAEPSLVHVRSRTPAVSGPFHTGFPAIYDTYNVPVIGHYAFHTPSGVSLPRHIRGVTNTGSSYRHYGTINTQECPDCERTCIRLPNLHPCLPRPVYPYATSPVVAPARETVLWQHGTQANVLPVDWEVHVSGPDPVPSRLHLSGRMVRKSTHDAARSTTPASLAYTSQRRQRRGSCVVSNTSRTHPSIRATRRPSAAGRVSRSRTAAQGARGITAARRRVEVSPPAPPSARRASVSYPQIRKALVPSHLSGSRQTSSTRRYRGGASTPARSTHRTRSPVVREAPVYNTNTSGEYMPENDGYSLHVSSIAARAAKGPTRDARWPSHPRRRRSRSVPGSAFVKRLGGSALRAGRAPTVAAGRGGRSRSPPSEKKRRERPGGVRDHLACGNTRADAAAREERRRQGEQERRREGKGGGREGGRRTSVRLNSNRAKSHETQEDAQIEPWVEEEEEEMEPDEEEPDDELEEEEEDEDELEDHEIQEEEEDGGIEEEEDEEEKSLLQTREEAVPRRGSKVSLLSDQPAKITKWDYSKMGEDWKVGRGGCASHQRQSPINFDESQLPVSTEEARVLQQQWKDQEQRRIRNEVALMSAGKSKNVPDRVSRGHPASTWAQQRLRFPKNLMIDAKQDETKYLQLRLGTNISRYLVELIPGKKVEFQPVKHESDTINGSRKKRHLMSSFGFVRTGEKIYDVINIHFHAPAEHTFNMCRRALELHIVCEHKDSDVVVIGITFEGIDDDAARGVGTSPYDELGKKLPASAYSSLQAVLRAATRDIEKPGRADKNHLDLKSSVRRDNPAAAAPAAGGTQKRKAAARKPGVAVTRKRRMKRGTTATTDSSKEDNALTRADSKREQVVVAKAGSNNSGEKNVREGVKALATPAKRGEGTGKEETKAVKTLSRGACDFLTAVGEAIRLTQESEGKPGHGRRQDTGLRTDRWMDEEAEESSGELPTRAGAAAAQRRHLRDEDDEEGEPFQSSNAKAAPWLVGDHMQKYSKDTPLGGTWRPWSAFDNNSTALTSEESLLLSLKDSFPLLRSLPSGHAANTPQAPQAHRQSTSRIGQGEEDKHVEPQDAVLRGNSSARRPAVALIEEAKANERAGSAVAATQRKGDKRGTHVHRRRKSIIDSDETETLLPTLNLQALLTGESRTFYRYNGSLTTPPCSEVVLWYVLKEPLYVRKSLLQALQKVLIPPEGGHQGTYRALQNAELFQLASQPHQQQQHQLPRSKRARNAEPQSPLEAPSLALLHLALHLSSATKPFGPSQQQAHCHGDQGTRPRLQISRRCRSSRLHRTAAASTDSAARFVAFPPTNACGASAAAASCLPALLASAVAPSAVAAAEALAVATADDPGVSCATAESPGHAAATCEAPITSKRFLRQKKCKDASRVRCTSLQQLERQQVFKMSKPSTSPRAYATSPEWQLRQKGREPEEEKKQQQQQQQPQQPIQARVQHLLEEEQRQRPREGQREHQQQRQRRRECQPSSRRRRERDEQQQLRTIEPQPLFLLQQQHQGRLQQHPVQQPPVQNTHHEQRPFSCQGERLAAQQLRSEQQQQRHHLQQQQQRQQQRHVESVEMIAPPPLTPVARSVSETAAVCCSYGPRMLTALAQQLLLISHAVALLLVAQELSSLPSHHISDLYLRQLETLTREGSSIEAVGVQPQNPFLRTGGGYSSGSVGHSDMIHRSSLHSRDGPKRLLSHSFDFTTSLPFPSPAVLLPNTRTASLAALNIYAAAALPMPSPVISSLPPSHEMSPQKQSSPSENLLLPGFSVSPAKPDAATAAVASVSSPLPSPSSLSPSSSSSSLVPSLCHPPSLRHDTAFSAAAAQLETLLLQLAAAARVLFVGAAGSCLLLLAVPFSSLPYLRLCVQRSHNRVLLGRHNFTMYHTPSLLTEILPEAVLGGLGGLLLPVLLHVEQHFCFHVAQAISLLYVPFLSLSFSSCLSSQVPSAVSYLLVAAFLTAAKNFYASNIYLATLFAPPAAVTLSSLVSASAPSTPTSAVIPSPAPPAAGTTAAPATPSSRVAPLFSAAAAAAGALPHPTRGHEVAGGSGGRAARSFAAASQREESWRPAAAAAGSAASPRSSLPMGRTGPSAYINSSPSSLASTQTTQSAAPASNAVAVTTAVRNPIFAAPAAAARLPLLGPPADTSSTVALPHRDSSGDAAAPPAAALSFSPSSSAAAPPTADVPLFSVVSAAALPPVPSPAATAAVAVAAANSSSAGIKLAAATSPASVVPAAAAAAPAVSAGGSSSASSSPVGVWVALLVGTTACGCLYGFLFPSFSSSIISGASFASLLFSLSLLFTPLSSPAVAASSRGIAGWSAAPAAAAVSLPETAGTSDALVVGTAVAASGTANSSPLLLLSFLPSSFLPCLALGAALCCWCSFRHFRKYSPVFCWQERCSCCLRTLLLLCIACSCAAAAVQLSMHTSSATSFSSVARAKIAESSYMTRFSLLHLWWSSFCLPSAAVLVRASAFLLLLLPLLQLLLLYYSIRSGGVRARLQHAFYASFAFSSLPPGCSPTQDDAIHGIRHTRPRRSSRGYRRSSSGNSRASSSSSSSSMRCILLRDISSSGDEPTPDERSLKADMLRSEQHSRYTDSRHSKRTTAAGFAAAAESAVSFKQRSTAAPAPNTGSCLSASTASVKERDAINAGRYSVACRSAAREVSLVLLPGSPPAELIYDDAGHASPALHYQLAAEDTSEASAASSTDTEDSKPLFFNDVGTPRVTQSRWRNLLPRWLLLSAETEHDCRSRGDSLNERSSRTATLMVTRSPADTDNGAINLFSP